MKLQNLIKATVLAGAALLASSTFAVQIGPNPTKSSLEASRGPFSTSQFTVSRPSGYGAGTVYYPTNAGAKVGVIAIVPGFLSYQSSINWWGPRLASHGFVVITIDTYTTSDQPASRSRQQLAAIDQVVALGNTSSSPLYGKVDGTRTGVMGWSMGGGGSLISAKNRPSIKAAAPQAPWASLESFSSVTVPTLIFSCQSDIVAPVATHANSFYNEMSRNPKQLLEKTLGDHFCMNSANATVGLKGVSWMKRFVDGDTRYTSFACSNPNALGFSDFRTARCN
ncbi:MAG TPA: dienelactone hydrolase family protein [Rhizobacter sp.]|nr:dienelactone hydrolase family protein [Rhizobacter sp.]